MNTATTFAGHSAAALETLEDRRLAIVTPPPKESAPALASVKRASGFSPEVRDELRAIIEGQRGKKMSQADLAKQVGCSAATLSRMMDGTYGADGSRIEEAAATFLHLRRLGVGPAAAELIETPLTKDVANFLTFCLEVGQRIHVGHALPGAGLSCAARVFAQAAGPKAVVCELRSLDGDAHGVLRRIRQAMPYTRELGRGQRRYDDVVAKLQGSGKLVVIDGAHWLGCGGVRVIGDLARDTGCPIALLGGASILATVRADAHTAALLAMDQQFHWTAEALEQATRALVDKIEPVHGALIREAAVSAAKKRGNLGGVGVQARVSRRIQARAPMDALTAFAEAGKHLTGGAAA